MNDAKDKVCAEIQEIMRVYREQASTSYGVDTPGPPTLTTQWNLTPTSGFCSFDGEIWWKARDDNKCYTEDAPRVKRDTEGRSQ